MPPVPPINMGTMLGQLASGPPVGPIPVTPYAPTNVQPLWMPADTPGIPPKIVQPQRNQFQFGVGGFDGGAAGPMPGTSQGAPRNTDAVTQNFGTLTPQQQQARIRAGTAGPPSYGADVFAKALTSQGVNPSQAMPNYNARVAQSQPAAAAQPAAQSLSQTLAQMGVPAQLHPQIMQSIMQPALLGGGPVMSGRR